ncbi:hypothetical protein ABBQ38_013281 [Trebouxia sp. C0009 RCD-2024]
MRKLGWVHKSSSKLHELMPVNFSKLKSKRPDYLPQDGVILGKLPGSSVAPTPNTPRPWWPQAAAYSALRLIPHLAVGFPAWTHVKHSLSRRKFPPSPTPWLMPGMLGETQADSPGPPPGADALPLCLRLIQHGGSLDDQVGTIMRPGGQACIEGGRGCLPAPQHGLGSAYRVGCCLVAALLGCKSARSTHELIFFISMELGRQAMSPGVGKGPVEGLL